MVEVPSCHIELFAGDPPADDVRSVLHQAGYELGVRLLTEPHMLVPAQLYVIDGSRHVDLALKQCYRVRVEQTESYTPILFVTTDDASGERLACLECGADTML